MAQKKLLPVPTTDEEIETRVGPRTTLDIYTDIARAAGQGLTLGFGDEMEAAVRSAFGDKSYPEIIKEIRTDIKRYQETDPYKAYGAEILGSMLTGGAGVARSIGATAGRGVVKRAGLAGGAEAALYGAGTGETPEERLTGAAIQGPIGAVTAGLGQKIMPTLQAGAKSMLERGYPLTMGQAYGGKIGSIEQKISTPFLQESIQEARRRPQKMFVAETINEALKPIGVKVPEGFTGETAVDFAEDAIREAYSNVVPKAKFNPAAVDDKIKSIVQKAVDDGRFSPKDAEEFGKELADVYGSFKRNGSMTGELFKESEMEMSGAIRSFRNSNQRRQARVMTDIQAELRDSFSKQNPDLPDLQAANKAYRNMRPLVKLSNSRASAGGEFTPAALVKAETKGRARTSPEVVLAREARDVLGGTVPDSGTAGRLAVGDIMTATTPRKMLGLGANIVGSSLYEYPLLGRAAARVPSKLVRSLAPAVSEFGPRMGGLLLPEAQASEMQSDPYSGIPRVTIRPSDRNLLD